MDKVKLVPVSSLKVGSYVIIDNVACLVKDIQISRPGKHGHAKARISAVGLFDGKTHVTVMPGHDNIEVPIIEKRTAQVLSINNNIANVMDIESYETFNLEIPEELKDSVKEGVHVLYWVVLDNKIMKQVKGE